MLGTRGSFFKGKTEGVCSLHAETCYSGESSLCTILSFATVPVTTAFHPGWGWKAEVEESEDAVALALSLHATDVNQFQITVYSPSDTSVSGIFVTLLNCHISLSWFTAGLLLSWYDEYKIFGTPLSFVQNKSVQEDSRWLMFSTTHHIYLKYIILVN